MLTAFYKHPVEVVADPMISSALLFLVLGDSPAGGLVQCFSRGRGIFLSQQPANAALGGIFFATARASLDPSSTGSASV
jgi:hypothetical protein